MPQKGNAGEHESASQQLGGCSLHGDRPAVHRTGPVRSVHHLVRPNALLTLGRLADPVSRNGHSHVSGHLMPDRPRFRSIGRVPHSYVAGHLLCRQISPPQPDHQLVE
jgi:hypothetical protein